MNVDIQSIEIEKEVTGRIIGHANLYKYKLNYNHECFIDIHLRSYPTIKYCHQFFPFNKILF